MDKRAAKKEIEQLTQAINRYNKAFFQKSTSLVSDYTFDQLMKRLADLEQRFPMYRNPSSPTQRIGETPSSHFPTVAHQYPMYSLGNTYGEEEVRHFVDKVQGAFSKPVTFLCELKVDGVALNLTYHASKLQTIVTRGDGIQGDDITANIKLLRNLPLQLIGDPIPSRIEVRGEAFMSKEMFRLLNKRYAKQGKNLLANPRNAAAGLLRTKKPNLQLQQDSPLAFVPYSLLSQDMSIATQKQALHTLQTWGFHVFPTYRHCYTLPEIIQYIHHWKQARVDLPIHIDGIVIKVNSLSQQERLGATAKNPRWAVAFKYKPDRAATILEGVAWQVGRTGVITPVALLAPVRLDGTVVKRASLYNTHEIARLGLQIGDTVLIEKGGDIIPKIAHVDLSKRKTTCRPISIVTACPACHTALVQVTEEALYYCPNTLACPPQLKAKIAHFVQRKAFNITSIGIKTIEQLFEKKLIKFPVDLFRLRADDIQSLEGFQEKSTQNLLQAIQKAKKTPFDRVLFGLGIRYVGFTVAQKLANHCKNIDTLIHASEKTLLEIPEIGEKIADSVRAYFRLDQHKAQIEALRKAGVLFAYEEKSSHHTPLKGRVLVFSGIFEKYKRDELYHLTAQYEGRPMAHLSKKTDFLVVGKKPSLQKMNQARSMGVSIIEERDFHVMISKRER